MTTLSVRDQLVEHALSLIRRRGFNGFSYRDLAELVSVKTSSIHYYFPSKDDLLQEAMSRYIARRAKRLRSIDTSLPLAEQAEQYLGSVRDSAGSDQICLCGMLSAELALLPKSAHTALQGYYKLNEAWLARLVQRAAEARGDTLPASPGAIAQVLYGALQNSVVTTRLFGAPERLDAACNAVRTALAEPEQQPA